MPDKLTPEQIAQHGQILRESNDPGQLASSAIRLASTSDREPVIELGRHLRESGFLARLDPGSPEAPFNNMIAVFRALAEYPSETTGRLCEILYGDADFQNAPSRINPLLAALAAVRPMRDEAAGIFRRANSEGFVEVNGPLLLDNESPAALAVFEEIISSDEFAEHVRVDILHRALLPRRTRMAVLESCERLLALPLPEAVRNGLIETLFTYKSREWFGPAMYPPLPPAWTSASTYVLDFLIRLAEKALTFELPPLLRSGVEATREELRAIVKSRAV